MGPPAAALLCIVAGAHGLDPLRTFAWRSDATKTLCEDRCEACGKPGNVWAPTITAFNAASDAFDVEQQKGSLTRTSQQLGSKKPKAGGTLREVADMDWDGGMVFRGISWLTDEDMDRFARVSVGDIVPVVQLTSTTLDERAAKKFLAPSSKNVMVWGIQNMHRFKKGTALSMWEVSEYPEETEMLKPMCEQLVVDGEPEWRPRPEAALESSFKYLFLPLRHGPPPDISSWRDALHGAADDLRDAD
eukprot:gene27521-24346_t